MVRNSLEVLVSSCIFKYFLGLLLTSGFWLNLRTLEWTQLKFPPLPELGQQPPNVQMFSFRGNPTIFGSPACDTEGECLHKDVLQYNSARDEWNVIGELLHHRGLSTYAEVPAAYCDVTRFEEPDTRSAALIIGGIQDVNVPSGEANILSSVELFGCPNSRSIPMGDFPVGIYLTGGAYYVQNPEDDELGIILVCGGYNCQDNSNSDCEITDACWQWDATSLEWSESDFTLNNIRWAHVMTLAPDFESGSNKRVPLVLGGQNSSTEIWDPVNAEWKDYL